MASVATRKVKHSYLMEHPTEGQRLAAKVCPTTWVQRYIKPLGLLHIKQILDVGCGPGVITASLAESFPHAEIIGLDSSKERITYAKMKHHAITNLSFVDGNIEKLPFPDNSFDLVTCRFLLEYARKPEEWLNELARICTIGGTVLVQDIDYQFGGIYPIAGWPEEVNRVLAVMEHEGVFNPYIGRSLYTSMHRLGLHDLDITIEGYDIVAGVISSEVRQQFMEQLNILKPAVSSILKDEEQVSKLYRQMFDYFDREDSLTFSLLFTVCGKKG